MTRSEFDDIRAHITAESTHAGDLLQVARELLDDLEQVRMREEVLRAYYLRLLTAARATVAAETTGDPAPLRLLANELRRHTTSPFGEEAQRVIADASATHPLLRELDTLPDVPDMPGMPGMGPLPNGDDVAQRRSSNTGRVHRCFGASRKLPH